MTAEVMPELHTGIAVWIIECFYAIVPRLVRIYPNGTDHVGDLHHSGMS
jgi:hypothetical protein